MVLYRNGAVSLPEFGIHLRMLASSTGGECKIIKSVAKAGEKKRGEKQSQINKPQHFLYRLLEIFGKARPRKFVQK